MTPSARLSAAIEILDRYLAGAPLERALTHWARTHRFAGSSDRAAIRDTVFDAVRCRRSQAHLGGGETGRGLVLGGLRAAGIEPDTLFDGLGHGPSPLTPQDRRDTGPMDDGTRLDCPDWLMAPLADALQEGFSASMMLLRTRAPLFLRVNVAKADRAMATSALADEGIDTRDAALAPTALEVTGNGRRVAGSRAYRDGLVEVQDVASQAVVAALPLGPGMRVLDLCAGGGGKSLAMAARGRIRLFAHDADPRRMIDLPARAARAGADVTIIATPEIETHGPFDLILADVPCSGSGSWRRSPEGKWALSAESLAHLMRTQDDILSVASRHVAPGGIVAYVTCSMLTAENEDRVNAFLDGNPGFEDRFRRRFGPLDGGDGFFLALLERARRD